MKQFLVFCLLASAVQGADYVNQTVLLLDPGKGITISNSGLGGAQPLTFSPAIAAGNRIRWWASAVNVPNRNIEAATAANPSVITKRNHGMSNGLSVTLRGFTGSWAPMNGACTVANATLNTFTCGNNATGFSGPIGSPLVSQACSDPCSITINRNWGLYRYWYEEVDGAGNALVPAKLSAANTLTMIEPPMATPGNWQMPIEVVGQDMYVTRQQFNVPSGARTTGLWLYLRVTNHTYNGLMPDPAHTRLGFDTKMSVQLCKGTTTSSCTNWLNIDNTTTTSLDEMRWNGFDMVHTIAGPANTVEVYLPIPDNAINANGVNNIAWRFNGCEGVTSGYRILAWNLLDSTTNMAMSQIQVAGNVATATTTTPHGFSTNDWVLLYLAPGVRARFNGERKVLATTTSTFTFTPCTAGAPNPSFGVWIKTCTSPDGIFTVPTSYASTYNISTTSFPQAAQPVMYVVREILDPSAFAWQDPTMFTAPGSGDAALGHTLFTSRNTLRVSNMAWVNYNFIAACSDCHFDDTNRVDGSMVAGQDLAYFKFSNHSIIQRSLMHGLSYQQALDIAAYIRSINNTASPAIARPWNAPQSPCSGLEASPAADWLAGGGLDCQVTYDNDLLEYLAPGGNFSNWNMATGNIPMRDIPILWQHQDWLHYPPLIHPADAFPESNFFNMPPSEAGHDTYGYYRTMVAAIADQNATNFIANWWDIGGPVFLWNGKPIGGWRGTIDQYMQDFLPRATNSDEAGFIAPGIYTMASFGTFQWFIQKMIETSQPNFYGVCAMAYTTKFGASSLNPYHNICPMHGREIFDQGPHIVGNGSYHTVMGDSLLSQYPQGRPGIAGYNNSSYQYLTLDWYIIAMAEDSGNFAAIGSTVDTGYLYGYAAWASKQRPALLFPIVEAQVAIGQGGQNTPCSAGGNQNCAALQATYVLNAINGPSMATFTSPADLTTFMQAYADSALALWNHSTTAQWQTYFNGFANLAQGPQCADSSVFMRWYAPFQENTCSDWRVALPIMKTLGVSNSTLTALVTRLNQVFNVAGQSWIAHDFSVDLAATCALTDRLMGDGVKWWRCTNF